MKGMINLAKQIRPKASLFLRAKWESFFTPEELEKVDAFERSGFIRPAVNSATAVEPIRLYSIEMLTFAKRMLEKDFTPEEVEEFGVVAEFTASDAPVEDKIAFKRCLVQHLGTQARTTPNDTETVDQVNTSVVVGEVQEGEVLIVPEDQISLAELEDNNIFEENNDSNGVEETVSTNTNTSANTGAVRTRSEESTICSNPEFGLNEEVFAELFRNMKANLIFRGVEYGRTNTKQKADIIARLVAAGELPKFKNFRVATEEELNLYLIAHEGQIELPEGIVEEILRRCKERSKRTTGKWRSKQENAETAEPMVAFVATGNVSEEPDAEEIIVLEDQIADDNQEETMDNGANVSTVEIVPEENLEENTPQIETGETEIVTETQTEVRTVRTREELLTFVYSNLATMDTDVLNAVADIIEAKL